MNEIQFIEIEQPIGTFYLGKMNSKTIINHYVVHNRYLNDGVQREASNKRINEISNYCKDPDATFPTPIIISIKSSDFKDDSLKVIEGVGIALQVSPSLGRVFEIIDGQHRIKGIEKAYEDFKFSCDMVVVFMLDLTEEEKAYVFSTINSNQAKVNKSLIYDLFDLSKTRSPFKTSHYIARMMNKEKNSPFQNRLKMLGKKQVDGATLSQGTFVNGMLKLISKDPQKDMIDIKNGEPLEDDPKYPLREYFITGNDSKIYNILEDYFGAVSYIFETEWNSNDYILTKTTGYLGLIMLFPKLYEFSKQSSLSMYEFFEKSFKRIKDGLLKEDKKLTSEYYVSGVKGQKQLAIDFLKLYLGVSDN